MRKIHVALLFIMLLLTVTVISAQAGTLYTADLNGGQETPPNGSTATGHADCYLSSDETNLRIELSVTNFTNTMTACHVHTGDPGVAGPVTFGIGTFSGSVQLDWALSPTDVNNLKTGGLYINVHSNIFAGGEIRGQLGVAPSYSLQTTLMGSEEVPPTGSAGTGTADFTAKADGSILHVDMTVAGLSGSITASHLHQGAIGVNGPVIITLSPFTTATRCVKDLALTPDQLSTLLLGQMYANVHTTSFPGGKSAGRSFRPILLPWGS